MRAFTLQPRPMTSLPLRLLVELSSNLDRASDPWTVQYEVRLRQHLEAARLAGAIGAAARRHPLARARLASWRFQDRSYQWEIDDELGDIPLTVVACDDEAALVRQRD